MGWYFRDDHKMKGKKSSTIFVDLALPVAVNQLFTYSVPPELENYAQLGVRALAPFGRKQIIGFIVNIKTTTNITQIKPIIDILDTTPILSEDMLKLTRWISEYYLAPLGEVIKTALPKNSLIESKRIIKLTATNIDEAFKQISNAPKQIEILKIIQEKKEIKLNQLQKLLGTKNLYSSLNELTQKNLIEVRENLQLKKVKSKYEKYINITDNSKSLWLKFIEEKSNNKKFDKQIKLLKYLLDFPEGTLINIKEILQKTKLSTSTLKKLIESNLLIIHQEEIKQIVKYEYESFNQNQIKLNQYQTNALIQINTAITGNEFKVFLLHGITSSGKTQIYIEAIRNCLLAGKTAIMLVPEISLTPQIVTRFQSHFGDKVTVQHSRLSVNERYNVWQQTKNGKFSILIGPRSAVFAPLKNIGLIVVDEEHEASYKQFDQTPRYNARDVAIIRAMFNNSVVILGSATPSIESYYNAVNGKYKLLELPERVDNAKLPDIQIVDLRKEREALYLKFKEERKKEFEKDPVAARLSKPKMEFSFLSELLKEKIRDRLEKKEGVILLQNRRGFSNFIECMDCGYVEMCENCHLSLTYHLVKKQLRCHYCGFVKTPPTLCPKCNSADFSYKGFGTQRVEDELIKIFPQASIIRMDLDTTAQKHSHDKILSRFAKGEIDILLGTQMVAKGLDFSHVTLVGVISADTQMLLPDFRSAERTFQLLTQVAGRAGRSGLLKGEVIIQTFQPEHYTLRYVINHNYFGFYNEEISERYNLQYPPFSRIALIEIKGENESEVIRATNKFYEFLAAEKENLIILGPSEAAIPKIKKNYRWHILIKDLKSYDPAGKLLHQTLSKTTAIFHKTIKSKNIKLIIDIDPIGIM